MFKEFFDFVGMTDGGRVSDEKEFEAVCAGKSFKDGIYRVHRTEDVEKWNEIVGNTFPEYRGKINVFGYDWMGRNFAVNQQTKTVLLFDPGAGEVLDSSADFAHFHNVEIAQHHAASLSSMHFADWYEANEHFKLPFHECVSYRVPLFLDSPDEMKNLRVADMEKYWGIVSELLNL